MKSNKEIEERDRKSLERIRKLKEGDKEKKYLNGYIDALRWVRT